MTEHRRIKYKDQLEICKKERAAKKGEAYKTLFKFQDLFSKEPDLTE